MNRFTAEEVRAQVDAHADSPVARKMLRAYADSIERAQKGVTEEQASERTGDYFMQQFEGKLHTATACLVWNFALALGNKLAAAEKKYGYTDGWRSKDWMDECRAKLLEHVAKGDPRDVAAYCAFLWHHGERTDAQPEPASVDAVPDKMQDRMAALGFPVPIRVIYDAYQCATPGADAEDAARYRWLRDEAHPDSDDGFAVLRQEYSDWGKPYPAHITGSALDDLVDAARATKGGVANTEGLLMTDPPNPGSDEAEDEIENFEAWFEQRKKESWAKALLPGENKPCPQNWGAAYKPYFREAWLARAKFAA